MKNTSNNLTFKIFIWTTEDWGPFQYHDTKYHLWFSAQIRVEGAEIFYKVSNRGYDLMTGYDLMSGYAESLEAAKAACENEIKRRILEAFV